MGLGKFFKKVGKGLLAVGTGGVSLGVQAGVKAVKKKKAANAVKQANIDTQMGVMREQDNASLRKLLADQPERMSALLSKEAEGLKAEAYGTGPLAEFTAMREQARLANEQGSQRIDQQLQDELQGQAVSGAGARMNAYSQLAQEGGLSSGARERIASGGSNEQMMQAQQARMAQQRAQQNQAAEYAKGALGLTAQEAAARRGMQDKYLSMQSQDIQNENQFKQDKYGKRAELEAGLLKSQRESETARLLR